jgi:hypothetical protein
MQTVTNPSAEIKLISLEERDELAGTSATAHTQHGA